MKRIIFLALLTLSLSVLVTAQTKYRAAYTKVAIAGTSTFHDWDMISETANCEIAFNFDGSNITGLSSLLFTVKAESLKSDHKGLDKNAYKALNSDKYPEISFTSNYANVRANGPNNYVVSAKGRLNISGTTKEVWLAATCTVNPQDMSIRSSGSLKMKMTEYNVDPPTFMFGAMKTGDEITVKYDVNLKK